MPLNLILRNHNLLVLGLLKVKLSRAILSHKQALPPMTNVRGCLLWKLVRRANAANHLCPAWFRKKAQTRAEHFSVAYNRNNRDAIIFSGPTSRSALKVSSDKRQYLPQECHHHHLVIAKFFASLCVCARKGPTQAGGFSSVRSLKMRDHVVILRGLTNQ